jgi:hypothetical protein
MVAGMSLSWSGKHAAAQVRRCTVRTLSEVVCLGLFFFAVRSRRNTLACSSLVHLLACSSLVRSLAEVWRHGVQNSRLSTCGVMEYVLFQVLRRHLRRDGSLAASPWLPT